MSDDDRQRVSAIGGCFFRAEDPAALTSWYVEHLGLPVDDDGYIVFRWGPGHGSATSGSTVWAPFASDTSYFATGQDAMVNFRVDDLDAMLAQLAAEGIAALGDVEVMEGLGRFAHIEDPEGNRVELWEPAAGC